MESILTSIKKMLGITEEYEHFDTDLIMHINSVLMILTQLGVGSSDGFSIKGKEEAWTDFLPGDTVGVSQVLCIPKSKIAVRPSARLCGCRSDKPADL